MIKAVIFDLDNTIYSYDICNEKAMLKLQNFAMDKYGINEETFQTTFNEAKRKVKKQLGNVGASHNRMLYMQFFLEELDRLPTKGALELYDIYWDEVLNNMQLFPYVRPLFSQLKKRGIHIAMLTDLTAHIQHRKIKALGIENDVQVFVSSEEAGEEKPSIKAFDTIKKKLPCSDDEMIMVGDSKSKDIDGARHCGIRGMLFTNDHSKDMDGIIMRAIDDCKD